MLKYRSLLLLALVALFTTGCESLDLSWSDILGTKNQDDKSDSDYGEYKPKFVISFNEVVEYPRAEKSEREVRTFSGDSVWINIIYQLHSKNIIMIKAEPDKNDPTVYHLKMKLNHTGKLSWMYMSGKYRDQKFAILIDGVVYETFSPQYLSNDDDSWVTVPADFDEVIAKRIAKYSEKNYDHFNPSIHRLF